MSADPPLFLIDESARDSEAAIWFVEPAGFTALPLDVLLNVSHCAEGDTLRVALAPLLDIAPDESARQRFLAQVGAGQQLMAALCDTGTVYCAIGLHSDDSSDRDAGAGVLGGSTGERVAAQPLLSFLTLTWHDIAAAPPAVTAARAVAGWPEGECTRVEYLENVACGPVGICETLRMTASHSGFGARRLLQNHAYLPHPDGERLAVLTLSTGAVELRDDYRRILRGIVNLVSFDAPFG